MSFLPLMFGEEERFVNYVLHYQAQLLALQITWQECGYTIMSNKRVVKHHNVMDAENAEGGRCDISGFMDSGEDDIDSQVTY